MIQTQKQRSSSFSNVTALPHSRISAFQVRKSGITMTVLLVLSVIVLMTQGGENCSDKQMMTYDHRNHTYILRCNCALHCFSCERNYARYKADWCLSTCAGESKPHYADIFPDCHLGRPAVKRIYATDTQM